MYIPLSPATSAGKGAILIVALFTVTIIIAISFHALLGLLARFRKLLGISTPRSEKPSLQRFGSLASVPVCLVGPQLHLLDKSFQTLKAEVLQSHTEDVRREGRVGKFPPRVLFRHLFDESRKSSAIRLFMFTRRPSPLRQVLSAENAVQPGSCAESAPTYPKVKDIIEWIYHDPIVGVHPGYTYASSKHNTNSIGKDKPQAKHSRRHSASHFGVEIVSPHNLPTYDKGNRWGTVTRSLTRKSSGKGKAVVPLVDKENCPV